MTVPQIKFLLRVFLVAIIAIPTLKYITWAVSPSHSLTKRLHPTFELSELWIFSNNEPKLDHKYLQLKKEYEEKKLTLYDRQQKDINRFEEYLVDTSGRSTQELEAAIKASMSSLAKKYVYGLFIPILKSRIAKRNES